MKTFRRILVTSALPYANGPIHIGHLAGAYLPADLYCRYQRLKGQDVVYICGSDEHGVPILLRAMAEGVSPQEIVDRYHTMIYEAFRAFGMSFDYYGRTSSPVHHQTSQDFFRRLDEKNVFVLKTEEQLYDPEAGIFLADRFVKGTCPVCGYDEAYGDQCERCGSSLSPKELINPRSVITEATPILKATTHWYLPLGRFQPDLERWIAGHPEWKPNVLGQVRSWFAAGLQDRAVTRDLPWGVPVPEDVARRHGVDASGKVLYVWFEAPIGYISATREWAARQGDPERWKLYWQQEDTRLIHFIGKDNIVFHCIIFPAMLMQHGEYVLPDQVPANEFLNLEGRKLSTSRGWAVWLHEYLETFPPDLLRYALGVTLPETKDTDFSWREFQARVNGELADILGNFIHRTLAFTRRYFDGKVPPLGSLRPADREVLQALEQAPAHIGEAYETFRFREALQRSMDLARLGNRYFNETEPWHTRKSQPEAAANTLHLSLQLCAALSILLDPVLPFSMARLRQMLHLEGIRSSHPEGPREGLGWDDAARPLLPEGHAVGKPEILFRKIEDDVIEAQIQKLEATLTAAEMTEVLEQETPYAQLKPLVDYDDFARLDLRVGEIKKAEPIPGATKLLRLEVDLGFETRQIVAGIAQHYRPEDLVGLRVVVVANLKPKKIRGIESQGMLLMAEDRQGRLVPVTADSEPGSVVL